MCKTHTDIPEERESWVLRGPCLRAPGLQKKKPQVPVEAQNDALLQHKAP